LDGIKIYIAHGLCSSTSIRWLASSIASPFWSQFTQ
jgi:hypothetical protein